MTDAGRDEPRRTKAQCMAAAAASAEASLARQAARTPREAAFASLGPRATEDQISAWIGRNRPNALRSTA